jgi:predicted RNase H-like HicB family nuclease
MELSERETAYEIVRLPSAIGARRRWPMGAWIEALPGCAAWGYTKEEALHAIQDAAEAYVEDMIEAGEALPSQGVVVVEAPVVTVTHAA